MIIYLLLELERFEGQKVSQLYKTKKGVSYCDYFSHTRVPFCSSERNV